MDCIKITVNLDEISLNPALNNTSKSATELYKYQYNDILNDLSINNYKNISHNYKLVVETASLKKELSQLEECKKLKQTILNQKPNANESQDEFNDIKSGELDCINEIMDYHMNKINIIKEAIDILKLEKYENELNIKKDELMNTESQSDVTDTNIELNIKI